MFVRRASTGLAPRELALAALLFTTVVGDAFTPKLAPCFYVDFQNRARGMVRCCVLQSFYCVCRCERE